MSLQNSKRKCKRTTNKYHGPKYTRDSRWESERKAARMLP